MAFSDKAPSLTMVKKWLKRFKDGRVSFEDDNQIGRPVTASGDDNLTVVLTREMTSENTRITYDESSNELGVGQNAIHSLIERVELKKVEAKWVPHNLTQVQKQKRVEICLEWFQKYPNEDSVLFLFPPSPKI